MGDHMTEQTSTDERQISKTREQVIVEAARIEEACKYSSKGHFKAATLWSFFHLALGLPMVMLAGVAGAAAFSRLPGSGELGGYFSIAIVVLSSVVTFLNPNKKASEHLNAGNKFDAMLNKVRIFRTIECWDESSDQVLTERLRRHSEDKSTLNQTSPQIPAPAYWLARRGIKDGEADYAVDRIATSEPTVPPVSLPRQ